MSTPTIFFLGATGYLGSEFLILLNRDFPQYHVVALVRSSSLSRVPRLKEIYPNLSVVEGSLDDDAVIQEQVAKADIIINSASSDHLPSVKSTLAGLEKGSASKPGKPPLYIHVSGCGIISDDARGEPVENVKEWSDIGLDLKDCPSTNTHLESDIPIVEAGTRKENPVRTIILYPGQIYGVGRGVQRNTLWLRIFFDMTKKLGYMGTWGPGANSMNNVHVIDVASALLLLFKSALEGKAEEGKDGIYFCGSMQPKISYHDWTEKMGDYLFNKGILKQGGTRPMPAEVVEPLGHYGWSLLGGNQFAKPQRLARLGWEPTETAKLSLMDSFPDAIEALLEDLN
ncbi:hypothetical protein SERLA73DRAFT_183827 [Serpula lacrymans var. lacrymans S7.3]|uniref:NmrA-like domain-containing protein n=2 Tax=Serpula lacrymans var. lacrymans TaxID=341189 RepID=F8Q1W9_SERL3|nr:uncharacterized protein SERLADRAFT_471209 [Serpula lacrymans var. lacrymans S7.9]EGN97180.1 hypothetical protein SERLA73DRAFT_183827 [Serpula lacrymans var. lacrymans S7.3]EGO22789.1 hypothetical protein SERLADRAFT_471209 [Serpula lacrymans var. lacrymans S7.9]